MAVTARALLKQWFETGKKPTQGQFANLIDSFLHISEDTINIGNVNGLATLLANKASAAQVTTILTALGNLEELETTDKSSIVSAINELKALVGSGSGDFETFENDFVVSLSGGKSYMKWTNGQTVPAAGKTAVELLEAGAKEAIAPTANLSLSTSSFVINRKSGVDINVNYGYVINSLGATLANLRLERSRNGSVWTEIFSSPTPPASPYVDEDINGGAINNAPIYYRLTVLDSEGQTQTRTVQASFAYRSFLGYRSTPPETIADIIALGNSGINDGKARTFTGVTAGAGLFTFYAYRAGAGDLSGVIMDGSAPILGAFTKVGDITGVDEFGGSVTYRIYKSNAAQAFAANTLAFS